MRWPCPSARPAERSWSTMSRAPRTTHGARDPIAARSRHRREDSLMPQGSGSGPLGFTRREALKLGATIAGVAAVGCGSDAPPGAGDDAAPPPAADAATPTPDAGSIDATTIHASAPDSARPDAPPP